MKREQSDLEKRLRQFDAGVQAKSDALPRDEAFDRIQAMLGGAQGDEADRKSHPPPRVELSNDIKTAVYLNVVDIVKAGATPKQVAASVLELLEDTIENVNIQGGVKSEPVVQGRGGSSTRGGFSGSFKRSE